jgi:hypothetical protein
VASLAAWRVFEVVSVIDALGGWTAWLDGTLIHNNPSNIVSFTSNCIIGALDTSGTLPWNGDIAGIYIFSAQITGTDRTDMVDYLNDRFGLSIV